MAYQPVIVDVHEITITPVFRYEDLEDINASERTGTLQKKIRTLVEVRFAGSDRYQPVFPVDAFWKFQNGRAITYAERWAEQYREFLNGGTQKASGTPLEVLRSYGLTDSQLSLCKALKIYSVEALDLVEGDAANGLQMARNELKKMAKTYLSDRQNRDVSADEVAKLRAEIESMRLQLAQASDGTGPTVITETVPDEAGLAAAQEAANADSAANDDEFTEMTTDDLRAYIELHTGTKPHHRLSHESLLNAAREIAA